MSTEKISKFHIVNDLIRRYGFTSYLEYNKYDGVNYFDEIECPEKEIAFIPEYSYLDATTTSQLIKIAAKYAANKIVAVEELLDAFAGRKFDIIFFDPIHQRPGVDQALQVLPLLLNEGGFLLVHDCNPEDENITSRIRTKGEWVGETYKAFALFHKYNPQRSLTVSEDYGVGLILNVDLNLGYDIGYDVEYAQVAADRATYLGLCTYSDFRARLELDDPLALFAELPPTAGLAFLATDFAAAPTIGGPVGTEDTAHSQLFWATQESPYSEAQSQKCLIRLNGQPQRIRFVFPELSAPVSKLRFDFANKPASARLVSLSLFDARRQLAWQWRGGADAFRKRSEITVQHVNDELLLVSDSLDPNFELDIPLDCLERIDLNWYLEGTLVPHLGAMHATLRQLAQAELRILALETALQEASPGALPRSTPALAPGQLYKLEVELSAALHGMLELRSAVSELNEKNVRLVNLLSQHDQLLGRLTATRLGRWLVRQR